MALGFLKASCLCLPVPLLVLSTHFLSVVYLIPPCLASLFVHQRTPPATLLQNFSLVLSLFRACIDSSAYTGHTSQLQLFYVRYMYSTIFYIHSRIYYSLIFFSREIFRYITWLLQTRRNNVLPWPSLGKALYIKTTTC